MQAKARHSTGDELWEKTARVKRDIQELGSVAKVTAREKWGEFRAGTKGLEKSIENRIRVHPVKSLLIAAGAGLVIGMLLKRR